MTVVGYGALTVGSYFSLLPALRSVKVLTDNTKYVFICEYCSSYLLPSFIDDKVDGLLNKAYMNANSLVH